MIVQLTNRDTGKDFYINPDYITEVDPIEDPQTGNYSRVYMSCGHRTFIDVAEPAEIIWQKIFNNETHAWKHILGSDLRNVAAEIGRIGTGIKKIEAEIARK